MICLPEVPFNVEHFIEKVRAMQEKKPSIVIAVSEGVKLEDGRYVCELADDVHAVDAFGHKALTGTARYLANVVARNLDTKTRCIELSTLQRSPDQPHRYHRGLPGGRRCCQGCL